jgi:hypothetical protein
MTRIAVTLLLLMAFSIPGYWALAEGQEKPKPPPGTPDKKTDRDKAPKAKDRPRSADKKADALTDRGAGRTVDKPLVLLGKTVKLEFKLTTPEAEPTFILLCAADEYSISRKASDSNGEHGVAIAGKLVKFDEQGRLLLTFEATLHHMDNKEGGEATFMSKGSAILELDKAKTLTLLGEMPLKVTATLGD